MKFLITYYATFVSLSLVFILFDGSKEMFGYVVWFHLIYFGIGSVGWLFINMLIKSLSTFSIVAKFLSGLLVLNLIVMIFSNEAPSLILLGLGNKYSNYWVNFFLHVLFLASFLIASLPDIKKLNRA